MVVKKDSRKEYIVAGVLLLSLSLVLNNILEVNFRLLEPAKYVVLIVCFGFFLRTLLPALFFNRKALEKESTYTEIFNPITIPTLIITETQKMLSKQVLFRNALLALSFQAFVTFAIAFFFNAFPTSSGYVLLTFLWVNTFYVFYLKYKDTPQLKSILYIFSALGAVVIFMGILTYGPGHFLSVIVALFCYWAFLLGLFARREYIFSLVLLFLAVVPFLLIIEQANPDFVERSEFVAFTAYLLLLLGVVKDLFYDWVFTE